MPDAVTMIAMYCTTCLFLMIDEFGASKGLDLELQLRMYVTADLYISQLHENAMAARVHQALQKSKTLAR